MGSLPSISELIGNVGVEVTDINDDGTINFKRQMADGKIAQGKLDARQLASEISNQDVSQLPMTSPNAPINDSGLSFGQQVEFIRAKTNNDKLNYLKNQFGSDNVKIVNGQPVVKDEQGNWKLGSESSGWKGAAAGLSEAVLPGIGGAYGTALAGGLAAGLALSPLGAAALIAGGAGIGMAVGKATDIGAAHALGIRNELDATEVAKELGHEFLLGAAGESALIGLKMTPALFSNAMSKLKGVTPNESIRNQLANVLSVTYGVSKPSVDIAMNDAKELQNKINAEVLHEQGLNSGRVTGGLSPSERASQNILNQDLIEPFTSKAQEIYGQGLDATRKIAGSKTVDITGIQEQVRQKLIADGILDPATDKVIKKFAESDASIATTAKIDKFWENLKGASARKGGALTLDGIIDFEKRTADLAQVAASEKGGAVQAASEYIQGLMGGIVKPSFEKGMIDSFGEGVRDFVKLRGDYSNFLTNTEIIAKANQALSPRTNLTRLFGNPESSSIQQSLMDMGKFTGQDQVVKTVLKDLQTEFAVQEIAGKVFSKAGAAGVTGFMGKMKDAVLSPRTSLTKVADIAGGLRTPTVSSVQPLSVLAQPADAAVLQFWDKTKGVNPKQPLDNGKVLQLSTLGKAVGTINSLNEKQKQVLLNSPQLMQQMLAPVAQVNQSYQQTKQVLQEQTRKKVLGK